MNTLLPNKLYKPSDIAIGIIGLLLVGSTFFVHFRKEGQSSKNTLDCDQFYGDNQLILSEASSTTTSSSGPKFIALTFDDGPYGKATTDILDILKKEKVRATFFLIGQNVLRQPDIVKREIAECHIIANHSFDHSQFLATMSPDNVYKELSMTNWAISLVTGLNAHLFRPPYGSESDSMIREVKRRGYQIVMYDDEARDWDIAVSSTTIVNTIVKDAKPGSIILLHDGRDTQIDYPRANVVAALPLLIETLKSEGYTFVTADKLLDVAAYR